jgi:iron(III) transport system substrate-binding protein
MKIRSAVALVAAGCFCACSSGEPGERAVVVYTSVDRIFAEELFAAFEKDTGIRVQPLYDTESNKTLGLIQRLRAERSRPQCDVWWSGEAMRTAQIASEGILEPFVPDSAKDIPDRWRGNGWICFAARARVIVYNTERVKDPTRTLDDLAHERFRGRVAIARPRFGTTSAHVVALYLTWGEERTRAWLRALRANGVQVVGGNSHVRDLVARGVCDAGLTDTDDVWVGKQRGDPIEMVFPEPTLVIPNTVALVRGAPHPAEARTCMDWLVAPERERRLAESRSRQMPVRGDSPLGGIAAMDVDWAAMAHEADRVLADAERILFE